MAPPSLPFACGWWLLLSLLVCLGIGLPYAFLEAIANNDPQRIVPARTMRSLRSGPTSSGRGWTAPLASTGGSGGNPYVILCDAGSTGTRLYVYRRRGGEEVGEPSEEEVDIRVGPKVKPGLSAQTPGTVASYLRPSLIEAAATMVPPEYHVSTPVFVYATAGMRLLPEETERSLYDALTVGLTDDPAVPFAIRRENFHTISGEDEGYYAALAVNYLADRVGADLKPKKTKRGGGIAEEKDDAVKPLPLLGALDLGGASAQIVFPLEPSSSSRESRLRERTRSLGRSDFFSASLLGYGGDQMRRKTDTHIANHSSRANGSRRLEGEGGGGGGVSNPCYFRGYKATLDGVDHVGTGDATLCARYVGSVMEKHPPDVRIPTLQGQHFYAMTLYYYVLDFSRDVLVAMGAADTAALRTALDASNLSVSLLQDAASTVCGWDYGYLTRPAVASAYDDMTGPDNLPHRCLEFTYIVTLLKRLGFSDPETEVRFVDTIKGESVEWTLGAFLHLMNSGGGSLKLEDHLALRENMGPMFFVLALGGWIIASFVAKHYVFCSKRYNLAKYTQ